VVCLAIGACTNSPVPARPAETAPTPGASAEAPVGTIARHDVGDRIIVTASVATVITTQSFVIGDADLPDRGVLVLGGPPTGVRSTSLVTVYGTIDRFEFGRFAGIYRLGSDDRYARFDGHKIVLAASVRSWA
jgi:hypothetical protein